MVHFVGAGSGAPDLITLRGARLLGEADVVIYAGSLVNPELLTLTKPGCEVHDSAKLTLEEVIALIERAEREGKTSVRLHTGDPSIYGAVREQFDALTERGIDFDVCPGVSSFCGAAGGQGGGKNKNAFAYQKPGLPGVLSPRARRAARRYPSVSPSAAWPRIRRRWCCS